MGLGAAGIWNVQPDTVNVSSGRHTLAPPAETLALLLVIITVAPWGHVRLEAVVSALVAITPPPSRRC
jgi:hypothetical protein